MHNTTHVTRILHKTKLYTCIGPAAGSEVPHTPTYMAPLLEPHTYPSLDSSSSLDSSTIVEERSIGESPHMRSSSVVNSSN